MSTSASSDQGTVICPHCEKPIEKPELQKRDTDMQVRQLSAIYPPYLIVAICPHCKRVLTAVRPQ